jgi:hypothetical protein
VRPVRFGVAPDFKREFEGKSRKRKSTETQKEGKPARKNLTEAATLILVNNELRKDDSKCGSTEKSQKVTWGRSTD